MKITDLIDQHIVLLACGSFNPPTRMHLQMFELAKDYLWKNHKLKVVEGIMSPVANNFGKPELISSKHRFHMVELATESYDWIRADPYECSQKHWSRTLNILEYHQNKLDERQNNPRLRIMMLCGGDLIDSFTRILPNGLIFLYNYNRIKFVIIKTKQINLGEPLWNIEHIKKIITNFGIVVISRIGAQTQESLSKLELNKEELDNILTIDDFEKIDISSTKIRNRLRQGESIVDLTFDNVAEYIRANNLYI